MDRLRATIPVARIARYDAVCAGSGVDGIELYRWSNSVALAVFADLADLEVAMRSAMAREMAATYGLQWYDRTDLLDNGTLKLVRRAKNTGGLGSLQAPPDVVHGKLVATLMFGFWTKILGRGSHYGEVGAQERRIYDTLLWKPALRRAFPNVGEHERSRVETAARRVQALRNRVAHHEHIIWGVPIVGKKAPDGTPLRMPLTAAHGALVELASFVDSDFAAWLHEHSTLPLRMAECPLPLRSLGLTP